MTLDVLALAVVAGLVLWLLWDDEPWDGGDA